MQYQLGGRERKEEWGTGMNLALPVSPWLPPLVGAGKPPASTQLHINFHFFLFFGEWLHCPLLFQIHLEKKWWNSKNGHLYKGEEEIAY